MLFELPFDTVCLTNEWSLKAIKWCSLGVFKVSLVRSDFHTLTCELCSTWPTATTRLSSGARCNGVRFCDASHITQHWTRANYDTIRLRSDRCHRTIRFCICKLLLTVGLFCFCPPSFTLPQQAMWWCHCAHTPWQGSEPVWSFRYLSGNNFDLMTSLMIKLGAGEFIP